MCAREMCINVCFFSACMRACVRAVGGLWFFAGERFQSVGGLRDSRATC